MTNRLRAILPNRWGAGKVPQENTQEAPMSDGVPISFALRFEKDHASVKVTYNLSVPVGSPALIADFQVTVDGADLISGFIPGQTAFNGVKFHTLAKPDQDATVSFATSSNQGFTASDEDVLRGDRTFDDVEFSG